MVGRRKTITTTTSVLEITEFGKEYEIALMIPKNMINTCLSWLESNAVGIYTVIYPASIISYKSQYDTILGKKFDSNSLDHDLSCHIIYFIEKADAINLKLAIR